MNQGKMIKRWLLMTATTSVMLANIQTLHVSAEGNNEDVIQTPIKTISGGYEIALQDNVSAEIRSTQSEQGISFDIETSNQNLEFIIKKNNKEIYRGKGTSTFTDTHFERDILRQGKLVGEWSKVSNKPTVASNVVGTAYQDNIYTAGGWWGDDKSALEMYNPATNTWTSLASMNYPRYDLSLVAINNKLYAIGGRTYNGGNLDTNEVYDIKTNSWSKKNPLPVARDGAGIAEVNGKIYVIGGHSNKSLNRVDIYDPTTDSWTQGADMPKGKSAFGTAVMNNQIYIVGGRGGMNSVERYDPKTNTWKTLSDLNTARFLNGAQEFNGRIYAISGQAKEGNFEKGINSVEVYVPELDEWFQLSETIIEPRSRFGIAKTSEGMLLTAGWLPFATNSTVLYKPAEHLPLATYEVEILSTTKKPSYQATYFLDGYQEKIKNFVPEPKPDVTGFKDFLGKVPTVKKDKVWAISFNKNMNGASISDKGVYIKNQYGDIIPIELTVKDNLVKVKPVSTYESGEEYILFVDDIKDSQGKALKEKIYVKFVIEG